MNEQHKSYIASTSTGSRDNSHRYRFWERLIVTYFGFIGLLVSFIFFVLPALHVSFGSILTPILFSALYLPVAYTLWRCWSTAAVVVACALVSWFLLAILFVFTYFIWVLFGLLCIVYAVATGLFFDARNGTSQSSITSDARGHIPFLKQAIGVAVLALLFYGAWHVSLYGPSFDHCPFTTHEYTVPAYLNNVPITLERDAYLLRSKDSMYCLDDVSLQLLSAHTVDDIHNPVDFFAKQGMSLEHIAPGETFWVQQYIGLRKKGYLFNAFSDDDYYVLLILVDAQGNRYALKRTELGVQVHEFFLSFPRDAEHSEWMTYMLLENAV